MLDVVWSAISAPSLHPKLSPPSIGAAGLLEGPPLRLAVRRSGRAEPRADRAGTSWGARLPVADCEHIRPLAGGEVPHVHAFRPTDPRAPGQRLVDMPEERQSGLLGLDRLEQRLASPLEP